MIYGKIKLMSLTRKIAFNTIIQIIGKVATTAISLVLVATLTRYLGVAGYGQYTTIFAYIAFFGVIADFGFFWILVREIAHPQADVHKITSNILTLRTIFGTAVYLAAFLIGFLVPQYHDFRFGIGIIALASLFLTLNQTYVGVFQNKLRMDLAALTDAVSRAIILAVTLYLVKLQTGLNAILWAYAIGNIINFFLSAYLGRTFVNFKIACDWDYWKKIFIQTIPMGVVLILNLIYFKVDTLMLSLLKSSTDVGIYGPPYKVLEILLFFPAIFMGNVFPIITRYIYENDKRVESAIQKSFDFLFMLAVPVILGVIFTAYRVINIVAGPEFLTASTISPVFGLPATSVTALQILILAVGVSFLSHLFGYVVVALGKQKNLIVPNIILVIFNIGLNLILIPKISYIGAAIVTVLTEILVLAFSWYVAKKNLDFHLNLNIIWKSLLSGAVLAIFLYLAASWNLMLLLAGAILIYGASIWLFGGINKKMIADMVGGEK